MDFFDTRYFKINKFFLSFASFWPYHTFFMKCLTRLYMIFGLTTMLVPQVTTWITIILEFSEFEENEDVNLVQKIIYIFRQANNLDSTFELMPVLSGTVICIAKFVSTIQNPELFKAVLQHMRNDWNNLLTKEETHILMQYAEKSRKITKAYSTCVIGFTLCYSLLPLTSSVLDIILPLNETRPKKLPQLMDYVIIDQEKHYYSILVLLYFDNVVLLSTVVATDTLYILLVEHICGMYTILCYRLENLRTHNKWVDNDSTHEEIDRCVRGCIQLHKEILLYTKMVEQKIAMFLFFDIGLGFLFHSSSCVMIVVRTASPEIIRYVGLVIMQSCRLFFTNWAGQEVNDHSVQVSIAAYNGMWYNTSVKVQKLFLFFIARGQKASQITVAKLYDVNLQNFTTVMKTSVSYCTVMISLR